MRAWVGGAVTALVLAASSLTAVAQVTVDAPARRPEAIIDLATEEGVRVVKGQWRYSDVKIVEVPAIQGAMPQYKTTYNIEPRAGTLYFIDNAV